MPRPRESSRCASTGTTKLVDTQHFGTVAGGTGIRFYKNALYAASPTTVYRFAFQGHELVPRRPGQIVLDGDAVQGLSQPGNGVRRQGRPLYRGRCIFEYLPGSGRMRRTPSRSACSPCPSLEGRSGVWRFDAAKMNQKFPADGEQIATGVRDMMAVDWSRRLNGFYGVMQGRNDRNDTVAEELHRIDKGANLGWPYTYYDKALKARLTAPEYGGDGKTPAEGNYTAPLAGLPAHQSPLDLVFYDGKQFPRIIAAAPLSFIMAAPGAELAARPSRL